MALHASALGSEHRRGEAHEQDDGRAGHAGQGEGEDELSFRIFRRVPPIVLAIAFLHLDRELSLLFSNIEHPDKWLIKVK